MKNVFLFLVVQSIVGLQALADASLQGELVTRTVRGQIYCGNLTEIPAQVIIGGEKQTQIVLRKAPEDVNNSSDLIDIVVYAAKDKQSHPPLKRQRNKETQALLERVRNCDSKILDRTICFRGDLTILHSPGKLEEVYQSLAAEQVEAGKDSLCGQ